MEGGERGGFGVIHIARCATIVGMGLLTLTCATPLTESDVEARLRSAASSVRGLGSDFLVVPVHADSKVAAWTLMAEARAEGATAMSRRLSHDFLREAQRRRSIVIGGPFSELTREIVLDAFGLLEDRSLDGLTLVYVGEAAQAGDLRLATRARRARFHHRELP
jgi:hypothetical protein